MKGIFPHYWSWNTKWSSACLSFSNWASACEHQIGSQLCYFPDFQFGRTSWKRLWVKSISCWSLQVVSLHRQFMSVWYIRKTLKHGQFWKSNTWHLLILLWDDSLPGWANGSSVGQIPFAQPGSESSQSKMSKCHVLLFQNCPCFNVFLIYQTDINWRCRLTTWRDQHEMLLTQRCFQLVPPNWKSGKWQSWDPIWCSQADAQFAKLRHALDHLVFQLQ